MSDCFTHATRLLRNHGWSVTRILRVASAGDSGSGLEEIDYLDDDGKPRTATVHPDPDKGTVRVKSVRWSDRLDD